MVRRTEIEDPECELCGYSLLGLEESAVPDCPECGSPINWSRQYSGATHPIRQRLSALAMILAPQAGIALFILYFGSPRTTAAALAVLAAFLAVPLLTIAGLHMLLTISGPTTGRKRATAAIGGLLLGPLLSILTSMICITIVTAW